MGNRLSRRFATIAPVLAVILGACSSGGSGGGGNIAAACKENVQVNQGFEKLFNGIPELQNSGPEQKPTPAVLEKIQSGYDQYLAPVFAKIKTDAPDDIKPDVTAAIASVKKFRDTGDGSTFDSPEAQKHTDKIDRYFYAKCPGKKVAVDAADYAYSGFPSELAAGTTQVKFTNKGAEPHMMVFLQKAPGVTETFDQILALPQEQGRAKTKSFGEVDAKPGAASYLATELPAGDYMLVCFQPKGSTSDKEGTGPPHFTIGMKQPLQVK